MVSSFRKDYSIVAAGGPSFGVADGYGKGGVLTRTTHLSSQKSDCWIDGSGFVSYKSSDYPDMIHSNKNRFYYLSIYEWSVSM